MPISSEIIDRTLASKQGTQALSVAETLEDAGHEAWWVGGCVRDMLMGHVPDDIDIATSANPAQMKNLFRKYDDTSAKLGALLINQGGCTFEVTTFRQEHELSDGRFPESIHFTDRETDAKRRDITINAIYWHPISGEFYDPFEGEIDLNEKLIRIIGDPATRLQHDALRLLRVIRFRALVGGQYHPDTFQALHRNAGLVTSLSGTRRFQELRKVLSGPHPEIAFEDMWETDVLEHFIPDLYNCKGVAQPNPPHGEGDVWTHTLQILSSFTDDHGADVRLAALFHDIAKPVTFSIEADRIHFNEHASIGANMTKEILESLQCPKKVSDKVAWLVDHHMMMGAFHTMNDERKSHWYYHPWFLELLQIFWLDCAGTSPNNFSFYEQIIDDYNHFLDEHPLPPKPLLSGDEVMEILGLPPGPEVGKVLKELYALQIEKKLTKKQEVIDYLKTK